MLTNWMGYDILKEVSISDILEAKMKRTIGERLKKARKDAKIRQGAAAEKMEMNHLSKPQFISMSKVLYENKLKDSSLSKRFTPIMDMRLKILIFQSF